MSESLIDIDARTILIVDDVPANLAVAVDYLEANQFHVVVAQDGVPLVVASKRGDGTLIYLAFEPTARSFR